jgi:hypothetical protein
MTFTSTRSLSGIDFVIREINKLRTEARLQVIDSSSKICSLRHPPRLPSVLLLRNPGISNPA